MVIYKNIFFNIILLLFTIVFFTYTNIDIKLEDYFFNFQTHQWILDRDLQPLKFIFYDGIKKLLILFSISLLISLLFFRKKRIIQKYKKGLIIVVLSAIFVPLSVGELKKCTNMPCPKNEIHYGGEYIKTKLWESYPKECQPKNNICCWPAGHASGGFALLSLLFLVETKRLKTVTVISALVIGWSMGIYKMLIGDHFLSHTIITMILTWLIILLISKVVYKISIT